jgi:hypothetical protein
MQRPDCNNELHADFQEKPGKARVGHFFREKWTPGNTKKWCGWLFRSRFHFPLEHLKSKVKLLLEAKLHMRNGSTQEDPDLPQNWPLKLYVLNSAQLNLFSIPDQNFYKNLEIECDVTQQVTDWILGNDINFGFVAAGPYKNFQDANIYFATFFRPELEIWYIEEK